MAHMAADPKAQRTPAAGQNAKGPGLTRRSVLGVAVAGGAGVAALRLLGLNGATHLAVPRTGTFDWVSPLRDERAQTLQLLRRAAFGATAAQTEKALSDGFRKTLDRLVETPAAPAPAFPGGETASRTSPIKVVDLQRWWVDHMLTTPTPFAERMTLFWHGHLTSDYRKVGLQYPFIYWQNLTWRANALGDFRTFLYQATIDPAMLRYLDLSTSTGRSPNENYSRELMELFTMGAGTFSEADVRAGAKALAGWREPRTQAQVAAERADPRLTAAQQARVNPSYDSGRTGVFDPKRAFDGQLTFLGKTGKFDTQAVIDRILAQKATAPYIVRRVLINFVTPNPSDAYVNRLAGNFVKSKWSIRQLMHDVFSSDEFRAPTSYRALVKSPVEFMVHAMRAVGAANATQLVSQYGSGMGQNLFDMPDVGGWPINEGWISSNSVLARINFVTALLKATRTLPAAADAHSHHLDSILSPATAALLNASSSDAERWTAVLASPEFQLK